VTIVATAHNDYEALSTLLWRERELLDLLLYKAEEKRYLIVNAKDRWLARVAREIEIILGQLQTLEVERAARSESLAAVLDLEPNPSLQQIAQAAPAPWNTLLGEHHTHLLDLVTEIRGLSDANRVLIENGLSVINDALTGARTPTASTYTAKGRRNDSSARAVTLDGTL
jgi:flagellar biosynthesis/type III secretory pathway chaperone